MRTLCRIVFAALLFVVTASPIAAQPLSEDSVVGGLKLKCQHVMCLPVIRI